MDSSLKEIDNISDKKNDLTNSQKLRELISVRNEDDVNAVYNNDIVEIFIRFNGGDIPLKLKNVIESTPPVFEMISTVDTIIECEYEETHSLTEDIILCIRYEDVWKQFTIGNQLVLSTNKNKFSYPQYIAPSAMHEEVDIIFDIYYNLKKKGLTHPVVKLYFSDEFWEEFKEYQQYLL